jgi:hypothetical protein
MEFVNRSKRKESQFVEIMGLFLYHILRKLVREEFQRLRASCGDHKKT